MENLDPKAKAYLELYNKLPPLHLMEPQAVRDYLTQVFPSSVDQASFVKIENRLIPVKKDAEINVRVYTPEGQGPFPLFVYYHGGGWVLGDLETSDLSCQLFANLTGRIVVSVDYRLAPENKFPVPVEDSYEALKWVSENASAINGDASDLAVGGDSAGGNLATVVSLISKEQLGPAISAQVLIYPVTSFSFDTNSYQEFQKGFGLDRDLMKWFANHYIQNEKEKHNKYAAPLMADDLRDLPKAFIITVENDVLRDEGMAYAMRLKEDGVEVNTFCEPGLVHGYFTNMTIFPERIEATISRISQFLSKSKE